MQKKRKSKLIWGDPTQGRVWPERIVEGLNVSENSSLSSVPGGKPMEMNHLTLEAAKEVFSDSIVVGIPFTGHTLTNGILVKNQAKYPGSVLDTAITVEYETWRRTFPANRHFQSVCGQRGVKAARESISNNLFRT